MPLHQVAQGIQECPDDYCGFNSPKIETFGFHELNQRGKTNAQGMTLAGASKKGVSYQAYVQNGHLVAARRGSTLRGNALIGLQLQILVDAAPYQLEVMAVGELSYPVPAGSTDGVGTYVLEYTDAAGKRQNLCGAHSGPGSDLPYEETFGQQPREAILFEGDRIDTASMTIDPTVDLDWFNIGCAGHTLSKLLLTRNAYASHARAFGHAHADQQATLKLLAADYCGTGHPFTVAGQRLAWRDPQRVVEFFSPPFSLEARWGPDGATCLNEPRLLYPTTSAGAELFPDIRQAIADECPALLSKPCTDPQDLFSFFGADRVSANR